MPLVPVRSWAISWLYALVRFPQSQTRGGIDSIRAILYMPMAGEVLGYCVLMRHSPQKYRQLSCGRIYMTCNICSYLAFSSYDLYLVDKCSQVTKSHSCAMRACEKQYQYNTTILVLLAYAVVYLVPNYIYSLLALTYCEPVCNYFRLVHLVMSACDLSWVLSDDYHLTFRPR